MSVDMSASMLFSYASEFLEADSVLSTHARERPVRYHLVCHSIELSLKAFLATKGFTIAKMSAKPFGHDLTRTLDTALKHDILSVIPLTPQNIKDIHEANKYYATKTFEYPALLEAITDYPGLPRFTSLREIALVLVESLQPIHDRLEM